jgi:hypothetical protein
LDVMIGDDYYRGTRKDKKGKTDSSSFWRGARILIEFMTMKEGLLEGRTKLAWNRREDFQFRRGRPKQCLFATSTPETDRKG